MDAWTIAWLAWLVIGGALEVAALVRKNEGDTFSEAVWRWFSIKGKGRMWQLRRFLLLVAVLWLAAHFLTGGWV